jgi:TRAP-type C4-dicarboxylate transport system permease large subunit
VLVVVWLVVVVVGMVAAGSVVAVLLTPPHLPASRGIVPGSDPTTEE